LILNNGITISELSKCSNVMYQRIESINNEEFTIHKSGSKGEDLAISI